jgi:GNAT superfamily N-acetyltransferase
MTEAAMCTDPVEVSTDPGRLDLDRIHHWLAEESYWARGRSRETLLTAVGQSVNFGAYQGGTQVGYARLVTDRATFAWLCDVFVADEARGRGVGKALVRAVRAEVDALGVKRALLTTADAHSLYAESAGFRPLAAPARWMELIRDDGHVR